MTFVKRRKVHDWRSFLTAEELPQLEKIDAEIAVVDKRRRELSNERRVIQNRALQRSRLDQARRAAA